jgi:hypothetical protein
MDIREIQREREYFERERERERAMFIRRHDRKALELAAARTWKRGKRRAQGAVGRVREKRAQRNTKHGEHRKTFQRLRRSVPGAEYRYLRGRRVTGITPMQC